MNGAELAAKIDHAFLRLDSGSSVEALERAVSETIDLGLRSLCLPPLLVGTVRRHHPQLRICAVVSYPLGLDTLSLKKEAALQLIEHGADELDIVYDLFALVSDNRRKIELEARELGELTAARGILQKAIIETPILSAEQITWASHALLESPVDCVKTSTGTREATRAEHVRLIRGVLGQGKLVKASGGIRSYSDALAMLTAGADILGASASAAIVAEARAASSL